MPKHSRLVFRPCGASSRNWADRARTTTACQTAHTGGTRPDDPAAFPPVSLGAKVCVRRAVRVQPDEDDPFCVITSLIDERTEDQQLAILLHHDGAAAPQISGRRHQQESTADERPIQGAIRVHSHNDDLVALAGLGRASPAVPPEGAHGHDLAVRLDRGGPQLLGNRGLV